MTEEESHLASASSSEWKAQRPGMPLPVDRLMCKIVESLYPRQSIPSGRASGDDQVQSVEMKAYCHGGEIWRVDAEQRGLRSLVADLMSLRTMCVVDEPSGSQILHELRGQMRCAEHEDERLHVTRGTMNGAGLSQEYHPATRPPNFC